MSRTPKLGAKTCQCATCGLYFTGTTAFDRHRIPGAWGWEPMSDEARARFAGLRK